MNKQHTKATPNLTAIDITLVDPRPRSISFSKKKEDSGSSCVAILRRNPAKEAQPGTPRLELRKIQKFFLNSNSAPLRNRKKIAPLRSALSSSAETSSATGEARPKVQFRYAPH